jgi:hypothetical protein
VCAGHALIRVYEAGAWYLACAYPECGHRVLEGGVPAPPVQDVHLPIDPEETEAAA